MINNEEIVQSIKNQGMKPIFSDGLITGFRLKAQPKKDKKGVIKPDQGVDIVSGLIEITFVDTSKQEALGVFVIDRQTAEEMRTVLNETIKKFDETMGKKLSDIMPKQPQGKQDSQTSYR